MRLFSMIIVSMIGLLFSACTQEHIEKEIIEQTSEKATKTFVYTCEDDFQFTVRREGDATWLFLAQKTVTLAQVESASGIKYRDDDVLFWAKGEEALLELSDKRYRCKSDRKQAIWEAARLDGYDFRATGNEPGWHLLINAREIDYIGDHGQIHHHFLGVDLSVDEQQNKSTYKAIEGSHELSITLEAKKCLDSMSDDSYETTVTLMIDGKELHGCGKTLH